MTDHDYSINCNVDSTCYDQAQTLVALTADPNPQTFHQTITLSDALGRKIHDRTYTGTNPYTQYQDIKYTYDLNGSLVTTLHPNGTSQTTATYDAAGRLTNAADLDLGSYTYTYDQNGNELSSADPRGASGTVYTCYDGLNRVTAVANTFVGGACTSPYASYTYDSTLNSNHGVGRLTGESFASGPSQSVTGSYAYTYDTRGRTTKKVITIAGTSKTFQTQFNDADAQTTFIYNDGDQLNTSYDDNSNWITGYQETLSGVTTNILSNLLYSNSGNFGGPAGSITSASIGASNQYTGSWTYDGLIRQTDGKITNTSTGSTLYEQQQGYDALSNVVQRNLTLPQGTVNQTFCYDDLNRLTWAGSTGTPSCGTSLTAGTLTAANYTQTFAYDNLDRLTSGPSGTYSYSGASGQPWHAATSTSNGYKAWYDAAGEMICRAPTTSQTCTSTTQTGQTFTWDALNRLTAWQNQPTVYPARAACMVLSGQMPKLAP